MAGSWQIGLLVVATVVTFVSASSESSWFGSEMNVIQKVYDDCQNKNDIVGCLKGKALGAITKAVEQVRGISRKEERDFRQWDLKKVKLNYV